MLSRRLVSFAVIAALTTLAPGAVAAQDAEPSPTAAVPEEDLSPEALAALGTSSPRGAMYQFLTAARASDYDTAATHLNLTNLPPSVRGIPGADLARNLHIVLDQKLWLEWDTMSAETRGARDDGLSASKDRLGTIETQQGKVDLLLEQASWQGGEPIWKIANETVALIPELYDEFGYGPLGQILPRVLIERRILDVRLWQWVAIAVILVLAAIVSLIFARIATWILRPLIARSRSHLDDRLIELAPGPIRLVFFGLLVSLGLPMLGLALPVFQFLSTIAKGLTVVGAIWLLMRLVDVFSALMEERLVARGQAIAMSVVPLGRRAVKVVLAVIAFLVILQNFGFNVTGLIAGLGIGGLAFALAAQKSIENLFGGVTLIADRPVQVGDFCRFGDRVGTVEEVGLRSTRIRTLERTVVTIPNADFANMEIENFARRDRIWFHTTLGVRYETTSDQMRYLLVELKKLLVGHPRVHPDPARVRFVGFGAYSLDLEIFAYIMTRDINDFLAVREDLMLRIIDIVDESGTGFAFPSQTIYTAKDEGVDAQRTKAAMQEIDRLRKAGEVGLPNFRTEQLADMANKLEYPDVGSALHQKEPEGKKA